jgi:hypothetical protein
MPIVISLIGSSPELRHRSQVRMNPWTTVFNAACTGRSRTCWDDHQSSTFEILPRSMTFPSGSNAARRSVSSDATDCIGEVLAVGPARLEDRAEHECKRRALTAASAATTRLPEQSPGSGLSHPVL